VSSLSRRLAGSALAGAASGARSFTGPAALTLATRRGASAQPDRFLGRGGVKVAAGLLGAMEYGLDKLPSGPSRLAPPGLASRLAGAAGSGVIIARRDPGQPDEPGEPDAPVTAAETASCAAAAVTAALATAWLGLHWRGWAAAQFGHDWIGAVIEDLTTLTLAATAVTILDPARVKA
jgi:uncharacterized membrane protein